MDDRGKVVVEGTRLDEGTSVSVIAGDEAEDITLTPVGFPPTRGRLLLAYLIRALTPIFFRHAVHAQSPCRVLDPELQGSYRGPCVNGLAEGEGAASGAAEYRGSFRGGRKHGHGVKTWPNGD